MDHKPLEIIIWKPILSTAAFATYAAALQPYSLEVVFRLGEQQVLADTLTRASVRSTMISAPEEELVFQLLMLRNMDSFQPVTKE